MIILSTSISFSLGIVQMLYLLLIITLVVIFIGINIFSIDKVERITRYKNHTFSSMTGRLQNILLYLGLFLMLLFKNIIIDARKFIVYKKKKDELIYAKTMWGNFGETDDKNKKELIIVNRVLNLLNLKYKQKNFVKRKVFSIFVKE